MKKYISHFIFILLLIPIGILAKAQTGSPVQVTSFTLKTGSASVVIPGTGGQGNTLYINATGATNMEWKCTLFKGVIGQGTETFYMRLIYRDLNNNETNITDLEPVFTYQYNSSGIYNFTKQNVPLPAGLVGGKIYLRYYTNFEGYPPGWQYSSTYFVPTVPPPTIYSNTTKSGYFTRNNCGSGYAGSSLTYTVPANTYTSNISQADADQKAQNDVNTNGQTYVNTNGTCSPIYVITPAGTGTANWGYEENISWYPIHFQGSFVKIEIFESLDNGVSDVFYKTISLSTPNNGSLVAGLNTSVFTPLQGGWGSIYYRIKITSLANGVSYFSNYFGVTND